MVVPLGNLILYGAINLHALSSTHIEMNKHFLHTEE